MRVPRANQASAKADRWARVFDGSDRELYRGVVNNHKRVEVPKTGELWLDGSCPWSVCTTREMVSL